MRVFKVEEFNGWGDQHIKLAKFVNEQNIKQEDIVQILWANNFWQLFYFAEE